MVVLVIEDEPGIADFLRRGLESAGFVVDMAADGQLGLLSAQREEGSNVLDLGLPGLPGEQVLRRLRDIDRRYRDRSDSEGCRRRPCGEPRRWGRRLRRQAVQLRRVARTGPVRLRRPDQPSAVVLQAGGLTLDLRTRQVSVAGRTKALSAREFTLLEVLMRNPANPLPDPAA